MKTLGMLALCSFTIWAQAQNTSQIQGTVQDVTGSAVPGAEVRTTQTDTGTIRSTTTGPDGGYVLANLPIGPYRLEVSKEGFSTYVQTGIVLQVATNPTVDVQMKVGAVSELVQVEANATQVETEATGVGTVIENQRILELPLNGRVATDLIQYTPGVIPQGVAGNGGYPGTQQFVISGGQAFGVAFYLDGHGTSRGARAGDGAGREIADLLRGCSQVRCGCMTLPGSIPSRPRVRRPLPSFPATESECTICCE